MSNSSKGYIYIIDLKPMGLPGYKIGRTKNLKRRLQSLNVPSKGTLKHWWYVQDSPACEKVLHKLFPKQRIPQSEWFNISEEELRVVVKRIREWKKAERAASASVKPVVVSTKHYSSPPDPIPAAPPPVYAEAPIVYHERNKGSAINPFVAGFALCLLIFAAGLVSTAYSEFTPSNYPRHQHEN